MTLIPDDKSTKPSIVDEMARALRETGGLRDGDNVYEAWAKRAAAVVARRLREALANELGPDAWGKVSRVNALLTELEGERQCTRPGCRPGVCDAGAHLQGCPIYDNGRPL